MSKAGKKKTKKVFKTAPKRAVKKVQSSRALTISQVLVPEVGGKKLSLAPAPISKEQILQIMQRTPKNHIYTRQGKGGGTFEYVSGVYVKKVLNYIFGFNWDFRIKEHGTEKNMVWVLGELKVRFSSNPKKMTNDIEITKMQFGRADVKYYKDTSKGMLDFGNDLKAAATDALKKCAAEFGIASDVYGKAEFKELGIEVVEDNAPKEPVVEVVNRKPVEVKNTGLNNDYSGKLKAEIIKRNNGVPMTEGQMLNYLNDKLGMKLTHIASGSGAQILLAQLLAKK